MKKIINNKQYLQVKDIIYLLRSDSCFPMDIYYSFVNKYGITISENEYIEIENEKHINYINKSNLLSYEFLQSKSIEELDELIDEIVRESNLRCSKIAMKIFYELTGLSARLDIVNEKVNAKYFLSQIKEIKNEKQLVLKK